MKNLDKTANWIVDKLSWFGAFMLVFQFAHWAYCELQVYNSLTFCIMVSIAVAIANRVSPYFACLAKGCMASGEKFGLKLRRKFSNKYVL